MIGIITRGRDFGGLFNYAFDLKKQYEILPTDDMPLCRSVGGLTKEFQLIADLRPRTSLPVRHYSISFAPADRFVAIDLKAKIVDEIMEQMGYKDAQYIAVTHSRSNPHHLKSTTHDHDHLHIIANAITRSGYRVSDHYDNRNLEVVLRKIEYKYNLTPAICSRGITEARLPPELAQQVRSKSSDRPELTRQIAAMLSDRPTLAVWIERLEQAKIHPRFRITSRDKIVGVSSIVGDEFHRHSNLGMGWNKTQTALTLTSEDVEVAKAANLRTDAMSIVLTGERKSLFDESVIRAVSAIDATGRFKNHSLKIELKDDKLTIRRLRPDKNVLTAVKKDGEWEPVGVPNLDLKDLNELVKISGQLDIVQPEAAKTEAARVHKTRTAKNELSL